MPAPGLPTAATLDLWQAAEGLAPVERSLVLAAAGGEDPAALRGLPIGRRNARLLALHAALGGRLLEATAPCPSCGELAEFAVDPEALPRSDEPVEPVPVEADGFVVSWRPPDSDDVAAAMSAGDAVAAERLLLSRCVTAAAGSDATVDGTALPAPVRAAVDRAMAEADPLGEVLIDVACPTCGAAFVADLDVGDFVWAEVRARAWRLLQDVHVLARAYGWTEAEVLALGDRRRAAYLELVGQPEP